MGKPAVSIPLSAAERRELQALAQRRKTAQGLARRARIVLAAADGLENKVIVEKLGVDANTVGKWRRRFAERRLDGLYDEPALLRHHERGYRAGIAGILTTEHPASVLGCRATIS